MWLCLQRCLWAAAVLAAVAIAAKAIRRIEPTRFAGFVQWLVNLVLVSPNTNVLPSSPLSCFEVQYITLCPLEIRGLQVRVRLRSMSVDVELVVERFRLIVELRKLLLVSPIDAEPALLSTPSGPDVENGIRFRAFHIALDGFTLRVFNLQFRHVLGPSSSSSSAPIMTDSTNSTNAPIVTRNEHHSTTTAYLSEAATVRPAWLAVLEVAIRGRLAGLTSVFASSLSSIVSCAIMSLTFEVVMSKEIHCEVRGGAACVLMHGSPIRSSTGDGILCEIAGSDCYLEVLYDSRTALRFEAREKQALTISVDMDLPSGMMETVLRLTGSTADASRATILRRAMLDLYRLYQTAEDDALERRLSRGLDTGGKMYHIEARVQYLLLTIAEDAIDYGSSGETIELFEANVVMQSFSLTSQNERFLRGIGRVSKSSTPTPILNESSEASSASTSTTLHVTLLRDTEKIMKVSIYKVQWPRHTDTLLSGRRAVVEGISVSKSVIVRNTQTEGFTDEERQAVKITKVQFECIQPRFLRWLLAMSEFSNSLPFSRFAHNKNSVTEVSCEILSFSTIPCLVIDALEPASPSSSSSETNRCHAGEPQLLTQLYCLRLRRDAKPLQLYSDIKAEIAEMKIAVSTETSSIEEIADLQRYNNDCSIGDVDIYETRLEALWRLNTIAIRLDMGPTIRPRKVNAATISSSIEAKENTLSLAKSLIRKHALDTSTDHDINPNNFKLEEAVARKLSVPYALEVGSNMATVPILLQMKHVEVIWDCSGNNPVGIIGDILVDCSIARLLGFNCMLALPRELQESISTITMRVKEALSTLAAHPDDPVNDLTIAQVVASTTSQSFHASYRPDLEISVNDLDERIALLSTTHITATHLEVHLMLAHDVPSLGLADLNPFTSVGMLASGRCLVPGQLWPKLDVDFSNFEYITSENQSSYSWKRGVIILNEHRGKPLLYAEDFVYGTSDLLRPIANFQFSSTLFQLGLNPTSSMGFGLECLLAQIDAYFEGTKAQANFLLRKRELVNAMLHISSSFEGLNDGLPDEWVDNDEFPPEDQGFEEDEDQFGFHDIMDIYREEFEVEDIELPVESHKPTRWLTTIKFTQLLVRLDATYKSAYFPDLLELTLDNVIAEVDGSQQEVDAYTKISCIDFGDDNMADDVYDDSMNVGFVMHSNARGGNLKANISGVSVRLRPLKTPLLRFSDIAARGPAFMATVDDPRIAIETVASLVGSLAATPGCGRYCVPISRSPAGSKYYVGLELSLGDIEINLEPETSACITSIMSTVELCMLPNRDTSPPLPWWDNLRYQWHGHCAIDVDNIAVTQIMKCSFSEQMKVTLGMKRFAAFGGQDNVELSFQHFEMFAAVGSLNSLMRSTSRQATAKGMGGRSFSRSASSKRLQDVSCKVISMPGILISLHHNKLRRHEERCSHHDVYLFPCSHRFNGDRFGRFRTQAVTIGWALEILCLASPNDPASAFLPFDIVLRLLECYSGNSISNDNAPKTHHAPNNVGKQQSATDKQSASQGPSLMELVSKFEVQLACSNILVHSCLSLSNRRGIVIAHERLDLQLRLLRNAPPGTPELQQVDNEDQGHTIGSPDSILPFSVDHLFAEMFIIDLYVRDFTCHPTNSIAEVILTPCFETEVKALMAPIYRLAHASKVEASLAFDGEVSAKSAKFSDSGVISRKGFKRSGEETTFLESDNALVLKTAGVFLVKGSGGQLVFLLGERRRQKHERMTSSLKSKSDRSSKPDSATIYRQSRLLKLAKKNEESNSPLRSQRPTSLGGSSRSVGVHDSRNDRNRRLSLRTEKPMRMPKLRRPTWNAATDGYRPVLTLFEANHSALTPPQTALPGSYGGRRGSLASNNVGARSAIATSIMRNRLQNEGVTGNQLPNDVDAHFDNAKIWSLRVVDMRLLWTIEIRDVLFAYVSRYMDMFGSSGDADMQATTAPADWTDFSNNSNAIKRQGSMSANLELSKSTSQKSKSGVEFRSPSKDSLSSVYGLNGLGAAQKKAKSTSRRSAMRNRFNGNGDSLKLKEFALLEPIAETDESTTAATTEAISFQSPNVLFDSTGVSPSLTRSTSPHRTNDDIIDTSSAKRDKSQPERRLLRRRSLCDVDVTSPGTSMALKEQSPIIGTKDRESNDPIGSTLTPEKAQFIGKTSHQKKITASTRYFTVDLIDPQINFLDVHSHGSLIIVAGQSHFEGRKINTAHFPNGGFGLDSCSSRRRNELRLQMHGVSAFTVPTLEPTTLSSSGLDVTSSEQTDVVHWKVMHQASTRSDVKLGSTSTSGVPSSVHGVVSQPQLLRHSRQISRLYRKITQDDSRLDSPHLKVAIRNFQFGAMYTFWMDVTKMDAANMIAVQSDEEQLCSFVLDLQAICVDIDSAQFYVILNVIRNVLLVPPPPLSSNLAKDDDEGDGKRLEIKRDPEVLSHHDHRFGLQPLDIKRKLSRDELKVLIEHSLDSELDQNEGSARFVEIYIGKGSWILRNNNSSPGIYGNDGEELVEIGFTGVYSTFTYHEDRRASVLFEVQRLWLRNLHPSDDSSAFSMRKDGVYDIVMPVSDGQQRERCTRCDCEFDHQTNDSNSCVFHADEDGVPGEFRTVNILDDLTGLPTKVHLWSCCGRMHAEAPGCSRRPHMCKGVMMSVRAEANPSTRIENVDISVIKDLEISVFPTASYDIQFKITRGLTDVLHRYFSLEAAQVDIDVDNEGDADVSNEQDSASSTTSLSKDSRKRPSILKDQNSQPNKGRGSVSDVNDGAANAQTSGKVDTNAAVRRQEGLFVRYMRVGDIFIDLSTSGFPINATNYRASVEPFFCRGEVLDWHGLFVKIERHAIWSVGKNMTSQGLTRLGNCFTFSRFPTAQSVEAGEAAVDAIDAAEGGDAKQLLFGQRKNGSIVGRSLSAFLKR